MTGNWLIQFYPLGWLQMYNLRELKLDNPPSKYYQEEVQAHFDEYMCGVNHRSYSEEGLVFYNNQTMYVAMNHTAKEALDIFWKLNKEHFGGVYGYHKRRF